MYKAQIIVTLKDGVLDPQGEAVKKSVRLMGYEQIENIRIGKFIELKISAESKAEAEEKLAEISQQLLANPVMENYTIKILEGELG